MQNNDYNDEIDLVELLLVLVKYRVMIFVFTMLVSAIAFAISVNKMPLFQADTSFFCLKNISGSQLTVSDNMVTEDLVISVLRSRKVLDSINSALALKNKWKLKTDQETRTALEKATNISVGKGNIISLKVLTVDPSLSMQIANLYLDELDQLNKDMQLSINASIVQIIDRAILPEKRIPRGTVKNTMLAGIGALFASMMIAFIINMLKTSNLIERLRKV